MRFAIAFSPTRAIRLSRKVTDWPLAYRFALLVLPAGIAIALVAIWLGYNASSSTLHDSLKNLTMLEAKLQAASIEETLKQLRHSLFRTAQTGFRDPEQFRESIDMLFQDNAGLIQEIGFRDASGNGFLLFRDAGGFRALSRAESSVNPYSPFQQTGSHPLQPGEATLFPAVHFDDPSRGEQQRQGPVIRMALQAPDDSGLYVIGISIADWSGALASMMQPGSRLRLPPLEDPAPQASLLDPRAGHVTVRANGRRGRALPEDSRKR